MPFAENGAPLDEETRNRLNRLMGLLPPDPSEERALGQKIADIRQQLEGEREQADETISRADILRRAYTERYS